MSTSRSQLLYSACLPKALNVAMLVSFGIGAPMLLGILGLFITLALAAADSAANVAVIGVLAVLGLLLIGLYLLSGWRGSRMAMNVTTAGIEVRGYWRDHWIPWPQVARIEQSTHWYWRRATCIVTQSGQRIIPILTAYQYLLFRGEPYNATTRDPNALQLPTRIAIDAHRRFLRGEFQTARLHGSP
jgi:hypothetical protein